jgi:hypothetical protein
MATATRPDAVLVTAASAGLAGLAAMATGLGLLLRSHDVALRAGQALQRPLAIASRLARRPPPASVAESLSRFRNRAGALLAARGWRITAATMVSYLTLWLVLLACLRGTGLSQAQVPWQTSLAAFAFIRLLTALPITPGGLGITELGLAGLLAASAGPTASAQIRATGITFTAGRQRRGHLGLRRQGGRGYLWLRLRHRSGRLRSGPVIPRWRRGDSLLTFSMECSHTRSGQ